MWSLKSLLGTRDFVLSTRILHSLIDAQNNASSFCRRNDGILKNVCFCGNEYRGHLLLLSTRAPRHSHRSYFLLPPCEYRHRPTCCLFGDERATDSEYQPHPFQHWSTAERILNGQIHNVPVAESPRRTLRRRARRTVLCLWSSWTLRVDAYSTPFQWHRLLQLSSHFSWRDEQSWWHHEESVQSQQ